MKTALVTALGSVSGDIVIKSLKRMGMRVIGCDIYPKEWVADAYNVDVFYRAPYVSDVEKYLKFVQPAKTSSAPSASRDDKSILLNVSGSR